MRQLRASLLGLVLAVFFGVRVGNQSILPATTSAAVKPASNAASTKQPTPIPARTVPEATEICGAMPLEILAAKPAGPSNKSKPCILPIAPSWKVLCELNPLYPKALEVPAINGVPSGVAAKPGPSANQCLGVEANRVLFVMASVPDPVHTHLGMFFDRAVDAIQVAASQMEFLPHSHYFPWAVPQAGGQTGTAVESDSSGMGVLVLRKQGKRFPQVNPPGEFDYLAVLLIPELPTRGLSHAAFADAKAVIDELAADRKTIWLAGPSFSGSVKPLADLAGTSECAANIEAFSGSVGNPPPLPTSGPCPPKLHFLQTPFPQALTEFVDGAGAFGYRADQIALLTEEGTKYGSVESPITEAKPDPQPERKNKSGDILLFTFPREISKLRNAYGTKTAQPTNDPTSQDLTLQWQDPQGSSADDVPDYGAQTQISQQAVLANISTSLRVHGIKVLGIIATNPMDTAFLLRSLKQSAHDVRFLLRDPDLLYLRTPDIGSLNGTLLLSNYPLIPENQDWSGTETQSSAAGPSPMMDTDHLISFASSTQEGEYNAFIEMLETISNQPGKFRRLEWNWPCGDKAKKENDLQKDGNSPCSVNPIDGVSIPPLWLAAIGTAGHFPLTVLHDDLSIDSKLELYSLAIGKPLYIPLLLWIIVVAIGVLHLGGLVWHRHLPGRYKYDLRITDAEVGPVKGACHLIAILCLALAQWILGSGYLFFHGSIHGDNDTSFVYPLMFWIVLAFTALFLGSAAYIYWRLSVAQTRYAGLLIAVAIFVGAGTWWSLVVLPATLQNAFLHFRDLNLTSGIAPALPLTFLILVFYLGIWAFVRRLAYWRYRYKSFRTLILDDVLKCNFSVSTGDIDRSILGGFKNRTWGWIFGLTFGVCVLMFYPWLLPVDMLEVQGVRVLVTIFICLVLLTLWLNWFRFLSVWLSLQDVLNRIETLPIKSGFDRLPHENSLPIWQWRGSDSCFLLRQIIDRVRALTKANCDVAADAIANFNLWITSQASLDSVDEEAKEDQILPIVQELVPWLKTNYWQRGSAGNSPTATPPARAPDDEKYLLAEDIVVLPFYDYIRHVVIELRNLLFFVVAAFCLLFAALHVYAFGADSAIDWSMIGLFIVLGTGVVIVLVEMDRNPLLRRLSDGAKGGLGKTFYFDLLKYGAVPLLTVLGSQVPFISNNVLRWLQPAVEALR